MKDWIEALFLKYSPEPKIKQYEQLEFNFNEKN